MTFSRSHREDDPAVVAGRARVQALKAEYAALGAATGGFATPGAAGGWAGAARGLRRRRARPAWAPTHACRRRASRLGGAGSRAGAHRASLPAGLPVVARRASRRLGPDPGRGRQDRLGGREAAGRDRLTAARWLAAPPVRCSSGDKEVALGRQRLRPVQDRHRPVELAHRRPDAGRPPVRAAARAARRCSSAPRAVRVELFGSLGATGLGHGDGRRGPARPRGRRAGPRGRRDPSRSGSPRSGRRAACGSLGTHEVAFDPDADLVLSDRSPPDGSRAVPREQRAVHGARRGRRAVSRPAPTSRSAAGSWWTSTSPRAATGRGRRPRRRRPAVPVPQRRRAAGARGARGLLDRGARPPQRADAGAPTRRSTQGLLRIWHDDARLRGPRGPRRGRPAGLLKVRRRARRLARARWPITRRPAAGATRSTSWTGSTCGRWRSTRRTPRAAGS